MQDINPVVCPRINVNDDTVLVSEWYHEHGGSVSQGDALCCVETSKASVEVEAPVDGFLYHLVTAGDWVEQSGRLGIVGASMEAIEKHIEDEKELPGEFDADRTVATQKALKLAKYYGVPIEDVAFQGVTGTVKERDVRNYLEEMHLLEGFHGSREGEAIQRGVEGYLNSYLEKERALSPAELAVANVLKRSRDRTLMTTVDIEMPLEEVSVRISEYLKEHKVLLSLLHVMLKAAAVALREFPRVGKVHHQNKLYRYKSIDLAFVVNSVRDRLITPVIHDVDKLDVDEIVRTCFALSKRAAQGKLHPQELSGACFTISHIPSHRITRFVALLNEFQSAILAVPGPREVVSLEEGEPRSCPMTTLTLTYDHSVINGSYAADFLDCLVETASGVLR